MLPCLLAMAPLLAATTWLPGGALTSPQVADTRETWSTVVLRTGNTRLDAAIADRRGLFRLDLPQGTLQLDLAAALYLGFDPGGELTFGITTVDGLVRLPLALRWRELGATLEWAHISAHFADGVRTLEDPLPDPGVYSREYLRLVAGWEHPLFQPYVGARQLIHVLPDAPAPGVQAGWSAWGPWAVSPYQATDLQWAAEHGWRTAASGHLGLALRGQEGYRILVAGVGRRGPDDTGKRMGADETYVGLLLGFLPPPAPTPEP